MPRHTHAFSILLAHETVVVLEDHRRHLVRDEVPLWSLRGERIDVRRQHQRQLGLGRLALQTLQIARRLHLGVRRDDDRYALRGSRANRLRPGVGAVEAGRPVQARIEEADWQMEYVGFNVGLWGL